jgi:hypothetical protein
VYRAPNFLIRDEDDDLAGPGNTPELDADVRLPVEIGRHDRVQPLDQLAGSRRRAPDMAKDVRGDVAQDVVERLAARQANREEKFGNGHAGIL